MSLADNLKQAGTDRCMKFGGYPVTAGQVCDSFERGKAGTERDRTPYEKPHHLHESAGANSCKVCVYYWANS
jgi:hypothetical protein